MLESIKGAVVQRMTESDLQMVLRWADQEGWNPGEHETLPLYLADPKGYYLLKHNEQAIASLALVEYSPQLAWMGLFIVLPIFRKKGYGSLLWDHVVANRPSSMTLALDGVLQQVSRYEKSGFQSDFLSTRWTVKRSDIMEMPPEKQSHLLLTENFLTTSLLEYDKKILSLSREKFLTPWLRMPESHTLVARDAQNTIVGYGVVSKTVNGYKIAPLFADDEAIADALFFALCSFAAEGSSIVMTTPESNTFAVALAKRYRMERVFDTVRMYKGAPPLIDHSKVVGLTSLEIGG
ncbi:MAG: hypothetical protein KBD83_02120 [Gammaproteobacteria bacterium]|nr:hypothetical protein [Gammaproteobacteria bacterium]